MYKTNFKKSSDANYHKATEQTPLKKRVSLKNQTSKANFMRTMFLSIFMLAITGSINTPLWGQTKTIHIVPEKAKIFVDGNEVGNGSYTLKFNRQTEFFMLKFEAPGYIPKNVKLFKDNPKKTIAYQLAVDEAEQNSVGAGEGIDQANRWFDVSCKKEMTEEIVWKRLMSIAVNNFDNIEVRDKAAGWIKTAWSINSFTYQTVRTRLEIKISFGSENELIYKVRVSSEIKDNECYETDQCFKKYPRVLKKYEQVINELQNSVGSNF